MFAPLLFGPSIAEATYCSALSSHELASMQAVNAAGNIHLSLLTDNQYCKQLRRDDVDR
jgi:hypothetical protein